MYKKSPKAFRDEIITLMTRQVMLVQYGKTSKNDQVYVLDREHIRRHVQEDPIFVSHLKNFAFSNENAENVPQKMLAAYFLLTEDQVSLPDRLRLLEAFERNMLLTAEAEPQLGKDLLVHVSPERILRFRTFVPQTDFDAKVLVLWPDVLMYYGKVEPADAYQLSLDAIHSEVTLPTIRCAVLPVFHLMAHAKLMSPDLSKEGTQRIIRDTQASSCRIQPCVEATRQNHFYLWARGMRKLNEIDFITAARQLIEVKKKHRVMPEIVQAAREVFSGLDGRTCEEKLKNCMASAPDVLTKPLVQMTFKLTRDVA